jgi:hypothetical protein
MQPVLTAPQPGSTLLWSAQKETKMNEPSGRLQQMSPTIVNLIVGIHLTLAAGALVFAYAGRALIRDERGPQAGLAALILPVIAAVLLVLIAVGTLRRARWARILGLAVHVHSLWAAVIALTMLLVAGLSQASGTRQVIIVLSTSLLPIVFSVGVPTLLILFFGSPRAGATLRQGLAILPLSPPEGVLAFHLAAGGVALVVVALRTSAPATAHGLPPFLPVLFFAGYAVAAWFVVSRSAFALKLATLVVAVHWVVRLIYWLTAGILSAATTRAALFSVVFLVTFLVLDVLLLMWAARKAKPDGE